VVWSHHLGTGSADPYLNGSSHQLHGLDTRDGRGMRVILAKKANYGRPLLTPDGNRILFTRKKIDKNAAGIKTFDLSIMSTDWSGAEPQTVAEGYALDVWKDPASGRDWVYAARDVPPTHRISWAAKQLVRFPLEAPGQVEIVWDQTLISPDNTQLSADGRRASGQAPWPHGGQFLLESAKPAFWPTQIGCWAGMAPDNSYLSWMLDGNHRQLNLTATAPEKKTWSLEFKAIPSLAKGEIYHPRWSNHPRFIALTGPYIAERGTDSDGDATSVIGKGGRTAEVVIAKLNPTVTGFEGSVTLTQNEATDAYPDLWIAEGHQQVLSDFPQGLALQTTAQSWPAPGSLAYVWENLGQPNQIRQRSGQMLECYVEPEGAALFGSRRDMQIATGSFLPTSLVQTHVSRLFPNTKRWTIEAAVLAPSVPITSGLDGPLMTLPGWQLSFSGGQLSLNGRTFEHPALQLPAHLTLRHDGKSATLFVNGFPVGNQLVAVQAAHQRLSFGPGPGVGLLGVAIHTQALPFDTISASAALWKERLTPLATAMPPRVRLKGKLVETTGTPTAEGIDPYTRAMVTAIYDVEQVLEGNFSDRQILVCHWALMDLKPTRQARRQVGQSYELIVEPLDLQTHHPELAGQRIVDDTTAFDLDKWYDIVPPTLEAAP
jgi:hypothetical protein